MSSACPDYPRDRGGGPVHTCSIEVQQPQRHLTDRHQPLPASAKSGETFSDPAATSYGLDGQDAEDAAIEPAPARRTAKSGGRHDLTSNAAPSMPNVGATPTGSPAHGQRSGYEPEALPSCRCVPSCHFSCARSGPLIIRGRM